MDNKGEPSNNVFKGKTRTAKNIYLAQWEATSKRGYPLGISTGFQKYVLVRGDAMDQKGNRWKFPIEKNQNSKTKLVELRVRYDKQGESLGGFKGKSKQISRPDAIAKQGDFFTSFLKKKNRKVKRVDQRGGY